MEEYSSDTKIFKAFCDANRLKILELLKDGEKCSLAGCRGFWISSRQQLASSILKIL